MPSRYVLGCDVGGTRLKVGAVTKEGALLAQDTRPSGYTFVPERLLDAVADEVAVMTQKLGAPPLGLGLGFSGGVDPSFGVVFLPGKIKGLEGYPVVPELRQKTGLPVIADNDGRLSILAERAYGLAQGRRWVVSVTIGTGVGSGVMLDGHILRDPHLQFGTQLSHMVQHADGAGLCITGARGTAEMRCSATALALSVRSALERGLPSVLSDRYFEAPRSIDFKAVMEGVEADDRVCCDAFSRWKESLGWLLVSAVHVYAPEVIILSGGALHAADRFLEEVQAHVNAHIFRYPAGEGVPLLVSSLGDRASVLGAAALAWEHLET